MKILILIGLNREEKNNISCKKEVLYNKSFKLEKLRVNVKVCKCQLFGYFSYRESVFGSSIRLVREGIFAGNKASRMYYARFMSPLIYKVLKVNERILIIEFKKKNKKMTYSSSTH